MCDQANTGPLIEKIKRKVLRINLEVIFCEKRKFVVKFKCKLFYNVRGTIKKYGERFNK